MLGAIDVAVTLLLSTLPVISDLASVFTVFWAGGMTAAAHASATTGIVRIRDVLHGVRSKFQPLFAVSLAALCITLVLDLAGGEISTRFQALVSTNSTTSSGLLLLLALFYAVVALSSAMALWFAPALIVLEDATPLEALKASLLGVWRNPWPTLVYGAFVAALLLVAIFTLGIALVVIAPLVYLSTYAASRDLFMQVS